VGQPSQFAQFEQPGHLIVQESTTTARALGPVGHSHSHFHGHRHFIVVFRNGAPCWFPVYTYYPYGYDVPVDTSSSTVSDTSDDGYVPALNSNDADSGSSQDTSAFSDLGLSWGQDLRREVATWNQFVDYLRAYVVTAPASAQADFREAFISAYRLNGATAYDKAAAESSPFHRLHHRPVTDCFARQLFSCTLCHRITDRRAERETAPAGRSPASGRAELPFPNAAQLPPDIPISPAQNPNSPAPPRCPTAIAPPG
jgi:hypothetical protein